MLVLLLLHPAVSPRIAADRVHGRAQKQIAAREGLSQYRQSSLFYKSFLESVRRHGRLKETEIHDALLQRHEESPAAAAVCGAGHETDAEGEVALQIPSKGNGALTALFRKAAELEEAP